MATASAVLGSPNMPPIANILLISKDLPLQGSLRHALEQEGYRVELVLSGAAAVESLKTAVSSLILLDVHIADISSRELLPRLRQLCPSVPALVLGAKPSISEKVAFLELGADDYVSEPFSKPELLARVRAALRRSSRSKPSGIFAFSDVTVDTSRMEVMRRGSLIPMTSMEFKLLQFFIRNPLRVISREDLLNAVWGYESYPTTRTVDSHILKLRKKLEIDPARPQLFRTVHGFGYKFAPSSETLPNAT